MRTLNYTPIKLVGSRLYRLSDINGDPIYDFSDTPAGLLESLIHALLDNRGHPFNGIRFPCQYVHSDVTWYVFKRYLGDTGFSPWSTYLDF